MVEPMASAKQRAANRANALKSTGPKSEEGKARASLNATKHRLSLSVDERLFASEIKQMSALVRGECTSDVQAVEIAKRIIDFERNEAFLQVPRVEAARKEFNQWARSSYRMALIQLGQAHRNKQPVSITFTTNLKTTPARLKGKDRAKEMKFVEGAVKLFDRSALSKMRQAKDKEVSALRYQRRAINQLVKGIRMIARGEEF
jgi:hypothetical protein